MQKNLRQESIIPFAIVSHGVVTRVICTREIGGETDSIIRYLPIHRFKSVTPCKNQDQLSKYL